MAVKFIFVILPQVHLLDLAGPDQTIHEAIDFGADFEIEYCGTSEAAVSSAGLQFAKQKHYSEVEVRPGDFVIVTGARVKYLISPAFNPHKGVLSWLKQCHQRDANLVSVCAGAIVLAQAGLLDGISCTTHFQVTEQLQKLAPRAKVKHNILYVQDGNIYTSAGIASGIDLMLHIVEQLTDGYFAHKVARELVIYSRRDGVSEQQNVFLQFRNHIHAGVHKAQDFIVENIDKKNSLTKLAQLACMSERNFTRIFKKETGITINNYINSVRLEVVKNLITNPDLTRRQIARRVGLESEKQVARLLKK